MTKTRGKKARSMLKPCVIEVIAEKQLKQEACKICFGELITKYKKETEA